MESTERPQEHTHGNLAGHVLLDGPNSVLYQIRYVLPIETRYQEYTREDLDDLEALIHELRAAKPWPVPRD